MYWKTVIKFKFTKYIIPKDSRISLHLLVLEPSPIYRTCVKRGKLPAETKANNLYIENVFQ